MADEFEIPDFLHDCDTDTIHERMLAELPNDIDRTQGGFLWDFTRPTALIVSEMLEMYIPLILQLMFPQWSTGQWLELLGNVAQIKRREATYATVDITVTGTPGTYIPGGTAFSTAEADDEGTITFLSDANCTIGENGIAIVHATAEEAGKSGNVPPMSIILMLDAIDGITQIQNVENAVGGYDEEDDDTLRERIITGYQMNDESYVGNDADYKRWAESVPGMGTAYVISEWNGPETIKIVCIDANGDAASQDILDAVYNNIMRPDSRIDRLAPPNTILTVSAPEIVEIAYSISVDLDDGYELDNVKTDIKKNIDDYYKTVFEDGEIRYTRVGTVISLTTGVKDYCNLTLNGSTDNIKIGAEQFPATSSITITHMGEVTS